MDWKNVDIEIYYNGKRMKLSDVLKMADSPPDKYVGKYFKRNKVRNPTDFRRWVRLAR